MIKLLKFIGLFIMYSLIFIVIHLLTHIGLALFVAWWSETLFEGLLRVADIFLLVILSIGLINSLKTTHQKHEEMKLEREEKRRIDALPETKVSNLLAGLSPKTLELLESQATKVEKHYLDQGLLPYTPSHLPESFPITELKVDNQERLAHLEKEKREIEKYHPHRLTRVSSPSYVTELTSETGIPYQPIMQSLNKLGLSPDKLTIFDNKARWYYGVFQEVVNYLDKELAIIGTGLTGEDRVTKELAMYEDFGRTFSSIRFEVDGQSIESDNIIVCTRGVFSLEVKNYAPKGNYSIQVTKDGQWLKIYSNGQTEPMNNVTAQMNRHLAYKQKLFNKEMRTLNGNANFSVPILPIFVIANDVIRIHNETDLPIMRVSQIYHHIMKLPVCLTEKEVEQLAQIIEENKRPAKKYPVNSYLPLLQSVYPVLEAEDKQINDLLSLIPSYLHESNQALLAYVNK